ncbi:Ku protein [Kineobactrum sediminis]|uniref:Ku protein n=1 Tax=Kineobactrum sediminis TaxID=1905677 RepID=A0A2N5Y740_9GAMM|nr:Ku protein [Kineobactrum sediminis]PLW84210.1 Ku protein [Kineobactrum sediminis]
MARKKDDDQPSFQPRSFWSGVVAFGLVSLPVSLFPANRGKSLSLKMVDHQGTPLRREYFCEKENRILERDEIVRGYPVDRDRFVIVEDEELEALVPEKSRTIDLRRFVPRGDINPVFFDRGYFLAPDSSATKAYRLLAKSMEDEHKAGVATFVMRDKEYLITIIAEAGILRAETLRFQDEIRSVEAIGLPALEKPPREQVREIQDAMKALYSQTLDRSLLTDRDTRRVRERISTKLETGEDVLAEPDFETATEQDNVVDLMQVLKERLQGRPAPEEHAKANMESLSRDELYDRAREKDIDGRSKMNKQELIDALKRAG